MLEEKNLQSTHKKEYNIPDMFFKMDPEGCINRTSFFLRMIAIRLFSIVAVAVLVTFLGDSLPGIWEWWKKILFMSILFFLTFIPLKITVMKRLRDIGKEKIFFLKSTWIYNIFLWFLLFLHILVFIWVLGVIFDIDIILLHLVDFQKFLEIFGENAHFLDLFFLYLLLAPWKPVSKNDEIHT